MAFIAAGHKPLDEANCMIIMGRYDKTADGRLDHNECLKLINDFVGADLAKQIDAKSVIGLMDVDNSKHIELTEISGLLRSLDIFVKPDVQAYLDAIWKKYDTDRSKLLEKNEIGQILTDIQFGKAPDGRDVERILRRCSKDGDLDVSKFEFIYLISEWFAKSKDDA